MELPEGKKLYFASDFHLGLPNLKESIKRERLICQWLEEVKKDMAALYLVGDIFDVWFEYKNVVPKGFTRFLGKLAELSDSGIEIHIFSGNHDIWMKDYFTKEFNAKVYHQPIEFILNGKLFFVGHGDGLGPGDYGYKILKKTLRNPISQWLYRRIHPDTGVGLADFFSKRGGSKDFQNISPFKGEKEAMVSFCREKSKETPINYFIFGHRHLPMEYLISEDCTYFNLGDWLNYNSYLVFDGLDMQLKYYKNHK